MITTLLYVILAIIGLGLLIFIHELGHYFMARYVGMKVEDFGIGVGKSIYTWRKDGVNWNLGWLPFGGYVRIAGMDTEKDEDPYTVPGGYFSKSPADRIKVALAGPLVNIIFALLLFAIVWMAGGREKNFSEHTNKIGWVDPNSELYALGVRPGDEIVAYDDYEFQGSKDHLYAPMTGSDKITVQGFKVDYGTHEKTPFTYQVDAYPHPADPSKGILTTGILNSASYIVYSPDRNDANSMPEGSPMADSGIERGDRIVWVDGEQIYSLQQLLYVLNDEKTLLTIDRDGKKILRRVPRVEVNELKLDSQVKEEITDWQHAGGLSAQKFQNLYSIPYDLKADLTVEQPIRFIDNDKQDKFFPSQVANSVDGPLKAGDRIVAVDGIPVKQAFQFLKQLQQRKVNIVVQRDQLYSGPSTIKDAEVQFEREINLSDLENLTSRIGSARVENSGFLHLLKPVTPKMRNEIALSPENQAQLTTLMQEQKRKVESIEDPEKRNQEMQKIETHEKELILGLPSIQDRKVTYNPNPFRMFADVFEEIARTFKALFTGHLNPKWVSGPVGIVQVVQQSWQVSFKEVLYLTAAISLNLGIFNLLPIPVLDGGYICFFLWEMITGRKISPKTMEKMMIPFFLLIVGFILFVTYNDVVRVFSGFFH